MGRGGGRPHCICSQEAENGRLVCAAHCLFKTCNRLPTFGWYSHLCYRVVFMAVLNPTNLTIKIKHHAPGSCSTLFSLLPWPLLLSGHFYLYFPHIWKTKQNTTSGHMPKRNKISIQKRHLQTMLVLFIIARRWNWPGWLPSLQVSVRFLLPVF